MLASDGRICPMSNLSTRALAARARATKRWYVYLILCRGAAIYTGIARNVAVRYARHVAGTGARYTGANPPSHLLVKFACLNQSEASKMEAAIKKLAATNKRKLVDKSGAEIAVRLTACARVATPEVFRCSCTAADVCFPTDAASGRSPQTTPPSSRRRLAP
jgi:putative endonuclease